MRSEFQELLKEFIQTRVEQVILAVLVGVFGYAALRIASDRENAIVLVFDVGVERGIAEIGLAAAAEVVSPAGS